MKSFKIYLKNLLKSVLPLSTIELIKKAIGQEPMGSFPNDSYRYSEEEAQSVYDIVISNELHHEVGPHTKLLEKEFAQYHGAKYSLATNSGTSALEMAIKAIGIMPGDEVIVPDYTFVATAQAVLSRGGIPVFADIDDTYTISPESIEKKITKKTKAIIPVHIFGNVANMEKIMAIAKKHKLYVIEDACQSIGATFDGKKVGSIGDIGCFSFDSNKAITTGQGGMLVTSNKKFFQTSLLTRETGQLKADIGSDVVTTGNTFAITEMQAVLARSALKNLDKNNLRRKELYDYFVDNFSSDYLPINWYRVHPKADPSYSRLVFMINFDKLKVDRNQFKNDMGELGLPFKTFYPKPLHSYTLFVKKVDKITKNDFPFSLNKKIDYKKTGNKFVDRFCNQQVGINFNPYIKDQHMDMLCEELRTYLLANLKMN